MFYVFGNVEFGALCHYNEAIAGLKEDDGTNSGECELIIMNIVVAVDSFKGSLTTVEAGTQIMEGILRVVPNASVKIIPVADGGEGTVETMILGTGGKIERYPVKDLLGRSIHAQIGYIGDSIAILEMAATCGISLLVPSKDTIRVATTYGLGQQFMRALDKGSRTIYIGLGGTATNDGGIGFAQAIGYRFYDENGELIPNGKASLLMSISRIDGTMVDKRIKDIVVVAITDVNNPLLGKNGSANVFGWQKGMDQALVDEFDKKMADFIKLMCRDLGKKNLDVPCAGAGGGMGMALMAFTNAQICRGIDTVLDIAGFDEYAESADLIITGEGRLDSQSINGKVPIGVAERAKRKGKTTVAVVGSLGDGYRLAYDHGLQAIESTVCYPMKLEEAMGDAKGLIANAAERLMRSLMAGKHI